MLMAMNVKPGAWTLIGGIEMTDSTAATSHYLVLHVPVICNALGEIKLESIDMNSSLVLYPQCCINNPKMLVYAYFYIS